MTEYDALKQRLAQGWNTWNTRSVLSHVLLPDGAAISLGIKEYVGRTHLREALIGRKGANDEIVTPGLRSYDGSYTELNLKWRGVEVTIQSATVDEDLLILVTPHPPQQRKPAALTVEVGLLWNSPGIVMQMGDGIAIVPEERREIAVQSTRDSEFDPYVSALTPCLVLPLDEPVGVYTGLPRRLEAIQALMASRRLDQEERIAAFGDLSDVYAAIQTCMAWDTVYDPQQDRVISPVSRIWNVNWGGYVLFCWDTYFAAYLASLDNRDLAYANAIEITRELTERGFVPNFATVEDVKSRDRSQPPVGSLMVRELYRRYGDRWLLTEVFDDLLEWNRWWPGHRRLLDGLLAWGSDPFAPLVDAHFETNDVNNLQGAAYESGLDNSPMYDDVPFDTTTHLMQLADVGLNGLYIADCDALAEIASVLGRDVEAAELRERGEQFRQLLGTLWDNDAGLFLNRRADTGAFSPRLSPTHFYPLLGRAATPEQAQRMVQEHFYNPEEFWGEWVLPSIARNDPAYPEQDYWRGRIWAPMNFLVYLGLRNYDLPEAASDLAAKSTDLLLREWREKGHVYENYDANTGQGRGVRNADAFYHWGALLGLTALIQSGKLPPPEAPLSTGEQA